MSKNSKTTQIKFTEYHRHLQLISVAITFWIFSIKMFVCAIRFDDCSCGQDTARMKENT